MAFEVVTRINDIIGKLNLIKQDLKDYTEIAANDVALYAVEQLAAKAPYDEGEDNVTPPGEEGHLRDSFYYGAAFQVTASAITEVEVKTQEPLKFEWVTQGTEDVAPIQPQQAKALWWPDAPHPLWQVAGQAPNPFQEEVYSQVVSEAPTIIQEALQPVIDELRNL